MTGSLDDFSIQDLLQIIAFGRKTGCLSLETEATGGSIVFRKGRVLASVDDGCIPLETELQLMRGYEREQVIRRRISASLDRFARSRQGPEGTAARLAKPDDRVRNPRMRSREP